MEDNTILIQILEKFPTGIMIISNKQYNEEEKQNENQNEVVFANSLIRNIFEETFRINLEEENKGMNYLTKLKKDLVKYRKYDLNKLSEKTLYDSIFNNNNKDSIETYFSDYYMIYVKVQFIPDYILISIENFNDERVEIRKKIIKSISFQYLTTIHHELNNPLNGLINIVEQVNPEELSNIKLSVFLIKRVIKKFILYTKCIMDNIQLGDSILSIINLKYVLEKIYNNMKILFDYKKVKFDLKDTLDFLSNYLYKCDQYYLKEYFKNIFMYLYYEVPKGEEIELTYKYDEDYNPPLLTLSFKKQIIIHKSEKKESFSKTIDYYDNLEIKETVKSVEVTREILEKISKILNTTILFEKNESTLIEVNFQGMIKRESLDQDSSIDSDINEFTKHAVLRVPSFGNYDTFNQLSNKGNVKSKKIFLVKEQNLSGQNTQANSSTAYSSVNYLPKTIHHPNILFNQKKNSILNKNLISSHLLKTKSLKGIDDVVELLRDPIIDNLKTPKNNNVENQDQSSFHQSRFNTYLRKESKTTSKNRSSVNISRSKSEITYDGSIDQKKIKNNKTRLSKISDIHSLFGDIKNKESLPIENHSNEKNEEKIVDLNEINKSIKKQENDILVVDDEEFNLNCMRNLLKLEKNKADYAINGEDCVKKVIENPDYKLIFMDIYMPIMDGLQASREIEKLINEKKVNKNLIIVIISAHSQESIQDQMSNISIIKRFIQKPLTRKKLQSVLSDFYY